jgi:hypothetical protein
MTIGKAARINGGKVKVDDCSIGRVDVSRES